MEKVNAMVQMQLQFKNTLYSNREYCLHLMLKNDQDQVYHYYTRVRYGSDLKVAEKLKFVLDFNETTFNKDSADALSSYLESTSSSSSSDKSLVTLYSSSEILIHFIMSMSITGCDGQIQRSIFWILNGGWQRISDWQI